MSDSSDRGRRLAWRIGIGVAVVGVASLGAFGIAAATSSTPTPTTSTSAPDHHGPWGGGHWGGGHWGGGGPFAGLADQFGDVSDISHATVVLAEKGGGSRTVLVQKGAVTSADSGKISLKSADGYARTYQVTKDTKVNRDDKISSVAKDEQVVVLAKQGGEASAVIDLSDLGWK
jgi:hypothetical protein